MGSGILAFILGVSGTGKSMSMRNFPPDRLAVVNVQGKILPFKGAGKIEMTATDDSIKIINAIEDYVRKGYKSIVVDDFQYVMANEFMRRSTESSWQKFTDIARHAWDIADTVRTLPSDVIVYVMCHTDRDDEGNTKIKTIGKLLDEKICLEGMSTIVLMTNVTDGKYSFLTQNNGHNTVKSPAGMFPSYAIDNDLWYVDQKIRSYYEIGEHLTDEEMAAQDEAVKKDAAEVKDGTKKKRSSRAKKEEEPAPKKSIKEKEMDALVTDIPDGDEEEVPFEKTQPVEETLPKRRSRKKAETTKEPDLNPPVATTTLYFREKGTNTVFKIESGEVIPDPVKNNWEEITKDTFEEMLAKAAQPAEEPAEEPAPKRRRRRRTTE